MGSADPHTQSTMLCAQSGLALCQHSLFWSILSTPPKTGWWFLEQTLHRKTFALATPRWEVATSADGDEEEKEKLVGNCPIQMKYLKLPSAAWVTQVLLLLDDSKLWAQVSKIGSHIYAKNSFCDDC